MLTHAEARELAQDVTDYKIPCRLSRIYGEAARELARYVLHYKIDDIDKNLTSVQERNTEQLEQHRAVKRLVEQLAAASPDERDSLIAALVTATR